MKINTDSWHYKLINKTIPNFHSNPLSKTSCGYCMATTLCLLWAVFWAVLLTAIVLFVSGIVISLVYIPYLWYTVGFAVVFASPFYGLFVGGVSVLVIFAFIAIVTGIFNLFKYILNRKAEKLEKEQTMMQAINDRRKGICTLVEYH